MSSSSSSGKEMRAILVKDGKGPIENLYLGTSPVPTLTAAEDVLVKIHSFGLNRMDILQREGKYPLPPNAPEILGVEFSGTVLEYSGSQYKYQPGQEVFGLTLGGCYSEVACVKSSLILPKPKELSHEQAAAIPENWLTAFQALRVIANLQSGEHVLIHAGASGVGLAAIQLARDFGASKVFTTVGSAEKVEFCKSIGADDAINYKASSWPDELSRITDGQGVDVIMDFIGANYWNGNLASLKRDGRMVMQGAMGGVKVPEANIGPLLFKRLRVEGTTLRSRTVEYQGDLVQGFLKEGGLDKIISDGKDGGHKHQLVIHKVYSWKDIQDAHREMEANKNVGKIIVNVD